MCSYILGVGSNMPPPLQGHPSAAARYYVRRCRLSSKQTKERLVEERGLDAADVAGLVLGPEVDPAERRRLDVTAQLGGGLGLSVLVLAEAEAGLDARADGVGVAVVEAGAHEGADAVLGVLVELTADGEGGRELTLADLCGQSQLRFELPVGVDGGAEAGPEGEVAVPAEQALGHSHTPHCADPSPRKGVLHALVLVQGGRRAEKAGKKSGLLALRAWHRGNCGDGEGREGDEGGHGGREESERIHFFWC